MFIFFILTGASTGLSLVVFPSSGNLPTSVSRAVFNFSHWTLIWTILFVYSIQVSAFAVFFGQFFKQGNHLFSLLFLRYKINLFCSFTSEITWFCDLDYNIH
jgi:hypothetical protein